MSHKQHPEGGLEEPPKGAGFTVSLRDMVLPITLPHPLLTRRNIDSARKNHGHEWDDRRAALSNPIPVEITRVVRDKPVTVNRFVRFTEDEAMRLATLATFVDHGLFAQDRIREDGLVEVGERILPMHGPELPLDLAPADAQALLAEGCGCAECTCGKGEMG